MKSILMLLIATGFAAPVLAKRNCTTEPKEKWMKVEDFKKKITDEMGYQISKFKTPGTCYEIYGKNKEGKSVEIYFNPVDATIVK
jgi:hypothetical protein